MKKQFLYGIHAVKAALGNKRRQNKTLYVTSKSREKLGTIPPNLTVKNVSADVFDTLVPPGSVHQQVVLETQPLSFLPLEAFCKQHPQEARLVILDQVTDPHNIGAILRVVAALEADALLITAMHSADVMGGTVAKVASGALEHVPIISETNLSQAFEYLKDKGFWCYGLDERGVDVRTLKSWPEKTALVFGAEGRGLRRLTKEKCDQLLSIPTSKAFPTLNVSTTVSIALYTTKA